MTFANPSLNGHGTIVPQPWLKETLRAFFEGVAWNGQAPVTAQLSGNSSGSDAGSMMAMSVNRFFDAIAWSGQPTIGVPIAPIEAQPETEPAEDSLTLDGFSDLFG